MTDYKTKTICEKLMLLEQSMADFTKTGKMDIRDVVQLIRDARRDANIMEEGLKRRKKAMVEAGIEEKYQIAKGKKPKATFKEEQRPASDGKPTFHATVKNMVTGEVLYDEEAHAGVVAFVNRFDGFDDNGFLGGAVSHYAFGNDLPIYFAFDQLGQKLSPIMVDTATRIMEAIKAGQIKNPLIIAQIEKIKKLTNK